jgi:FlaA1/EpsC-like NDP-sugar epimerase
MKKMSYSKIKTRIFKQLILVLFDSLLLILLFEIAFSIRLGVFFGIGNYPGILFVPEGTLIIYIFSAPIIAIPIFAKFGLYRTVIRFIDFKGLWAIIQSVSLFLIVFSTILFMVAAPFHPSSQGVPRSVLLIYWLLMIVGLSSSRLFARWLLIKLTTKKNIQNVVIYGAGSAGRELSIALSQSDQYNPVALIDDTPALQKHRINGLEVVSPDNLGELIIKRKVMEILIALPSVSRIRRREIINSLEKYQLRVRSLPSVSELTEGSVEVSDLHVISIKDLLGRESVNSETNILSTNIKDKTVLVTGAGGSIGSELCSHIIKLKPKALVLFEVSEVSLYTTHKDLLKTEENINILPVLGSVKDKKRFDQILKRYSVNTIYHAAAYKHVPMVEFNYYEGINNNIFGTLNCAQAAVNNGIETFVLISTDKAVRPTNIMGVSKRFSELILQALSANQSKTKFTIVRFGNVLGSSGSVFPLFKEQINDGGPITVTHKDMTRYFMTKSEAVDLVIQAGSMGKGGDVFVLDMGEPVKILDLAKKMIRLSGLRLKENQLSEGDIEIKYTGLRPGEKLYEELLIGSNVSPTLNPKIMSANEDMVLWKDLKKILDDLEFTIDNFDQNQLRKLLIKTMPEYKPKSEVNDSFYEG